MHQPVNVLFVCMGNICRSPTAAGVFAHLVREAGLSDRIVVRGAGTIATHVGESPDLRSQQHAAKRGYDLSKLRARHLSAADLAEADLVLAMDDANVNSIRRIYADADLSKLRLLLEHAPAAGTREVPDPYYGGPEAFEHVLDLVEAGCRGLLAHVVETRLAE